MFDVDFSELAVVGLVALLVVGPKDLPKLMRTVGQWTGRARGMARHLRTGFDTMVREAEIEEMNKRWEEQNRDIMAATRIDTWVDTESPMSGIPATSAVAPSAAMTPLNPVAAGERVDAPQARPGEGSAAAPPRAADPSPAPPPAGQLA